MTKPATITKQQASKKTSTDELAIKVDNVSKYFKLPHNKKTSLKETAISLIKRDTSTEIQHALDDVSFEVKKGEFFGVVGRNGSGKSTLLKIMAGVYHPTKGSVQVNGSLVPFLELGVGFNPELSGRDNVFLNGSLLGFSRSQMEEKYNEIVEFAELENFIDQKLKNYSSGMQVRLAFSIAIQAKGDILLLDEVLAVGDAAFQKKCYGYFEKLKDQKITVILVSHGIDTIKRFCTNAILLKDGKFIKEGDVSEVTEAYLLGNINQSRGSKKESVSNKNKIAFSIISESKNHAKIKTNYNCEGRECFVSLSIWEKGFQIGSIRTAHNKPLRGTGHLEFTIDKRLFNPGLYAVGGGLINVHNHDVLEAVRSDKRDEFLVEGEDEQRGGSLKLKDTWEYGS